MACINLTPRFAKGCGNPRKVGARAFIALCWPFYEWEHGHVRGGANRTIVSVCSQGIDADKRSVWIAPRMHDSMNGFNELSIAGRVATPGDSDWDAARAAWNLAADQNPVAVAFAESADDIAEVVSFAHRNDLKVAGQGTGHGAVALGPLD